MPLPFIEKTMNCTNFGWGFTKRSSPSTFYLLMITILHPYKLKFTPHEDIILANQRMKKTLKPIWRWNLIAKVVIEGIQTTFNIVNVTTKIIPTSIKIVSHATKFNHIVRNLGLGIIKIALDVVDPTRSSPMVE